VLADDVLLLEARCLQILKRYEEAREKFRKVIAEHPQGTVDWHHGKKITTALMNTGLSGLGQVYIRCEYYVLTHPNLSADAAKLGVALCFVSEGRYADAATVLIGLLPSLPNRPPSEDPLVRTPPNGGYLDFYDEGRFQNLARGRVDKNALLELARCEAVLGNRAEAEQRYNEMVTVFPASAMSAYRELLLLDAGKTDAIKDALDRSASEVWNVRDMMPLDKVREILKLPDPAKRIEAAKAYAPRRVTSAVSVEAGVGGEKGVWVAWAAAELPRVPFMISLVKDGQCETLLKPGRYVRYLAPLAASSDVLRLDEVTVGDAPEQVLPRIEVSLKRWQAEKKPSGDCFDRF
jgi:tetratricopeptide (TPR) repeat protein